MQLRCGGIVNNCVISNFPQSVPVKEFLKSVNIWRRYGQKFGDMFFDSRCTMITTTIMMIRAASFDYFRNRLIDANSRL